VQYKERSENLNPAGMDLYPLGGYRSMDLVIVFMYIIFEKNIKFIFFNIFFIILIYWSRKEY